MIDVGNVIIACATTGLCTLWAGWAGLFGSLLGQIVYYAWLRDILIG